MNRLRIMSGVMIGLACVSLIAITITAQETVAEPETAPEIVEPVAEPQPNTVTPPPEPDAETDAPPAVPDTNATEVVAFASGGDAVGMEATVSEEDDLISVTLNDVPMVDVVRMFTRISGANIIATSSNLQGSVTASLTDVEWYPAMVTILKEHNLTLEKSPEAEIYRVIPVRPDAPEPMIVRTLFLKYTTVGEITPVVKAVATPPATVTAFASRNAMVVRATAPVVSEVEELLKEIDIQSKQVCIEAKFLELSDVASKRLGIRWDSLDAFGIKLAAGPYASEKTITRLKTREDAYDRVNSRDVNDEMTELYDMYGEQFQENSTTWEEIPPGSGSFSPVTVIAPTRTVTDTINQGESATQSTLDTFNRAITESQAAILELDSLDIILSALRKTDGVSIVSNPKIIVDNGATNAFISVGEREPIIKTEIKAGTQDSPGDRLVSELATEINTDYIKEGYLETGISLEVIPVVKTEDLIAAKISPSLRRKIGEKTVENNSWPIINVKEVDTQFTLRSGQTVAIGGLIDTQDSKKISKIPLLGSIPLIGRYLFSHEEDVKSQVEMIIFVTLSLAQPDTLAEESGIPEDAKLVHKRMIESKATQQQMQQDLERIRSTLGDESTPETPETVEDAPEPMDPPPMDPVPESPVPETDE